MPGSQARGGSACGRSATIHRQAAVDQPRGCAGSPLSSARSRAGTRRRRHQRVEADQVQPSRQHRRVQRLLQRAVDEARPPISTGGNKPAAPARLHRPRDRHLVSTEGRAQLSGSVATSTSVRRSSRKSLLRPGCANWQLQLRLDAGVGEQAGGQRVRELFDRDARRAALQHAHPQRLRRHARQRGEAARTHPRPGASAAWVRRCRVPRLRSR